MAADPLMGQLMLFAGPRAPQGWMIADGSEISIMQNPPLFSIIGTRFGGDGRTVFALPDLTEASAATPGMIWCIAVQGTFPSMPG